MLTAGLDFGTTNSSIGYNNGNKSEIIKLGRKPFEDRTALFYSGEEREFVVGNEGIKRRIDGELGRLILSPKSFLNSERDIKTYIGAKEYSLEEIISIIIKNYKSKLERVINTEVNSVLLGRPVKFHDKEEKLDKLAQDRLEKAAKLAGFKNIKFQYEPVAAAKAYLNKNPLFRQGNIIIADLGGGTSDFSIVNINNGKEKVIGNNGIYLAGDELDRKFSLKSFAYDLGYQARYNSMGKLVEVPSSYFYDLSDWKNITKILDSKTSIKELLNKVEEKRQKDFERLVAIADDISLAYEYYDLVKKSKEALTYNDILNLDINIFGKKLKYNKQIIKTDFEEIIKEDVKKIGDTIKDLLQETGVKSDKIDKIVMTGGTSLIPLVRQEIEEILGKGKIVDSDTFTSVAYGLTLESYEKFR